MKRVKHEPFRIDRGIDRIVRGPLPEPAPGNGSAALVPAESAERTRIEQLYRLASLDDYLHEALQPQSDAGLLAPVRFRAAVEDAVRLLAAAATTVQDERKGRQLERASRLMSDHSELRELLLAYRNALLQG